MKKYQYPSDVEAAMDRFAEDDPGARLAQIKEWVDGPGEHDDKRR
jgi:hypothetical protein